MPDTPPRISRRARRLALITLAVLVVLPIAFVVFVATFDWNHAKPWLVTRASDALGRAIAIDGDVDVSWHWRTRVAGADRFSPGFGFAAHGLVVGNPDWAKRPRFAALDALEMDFRLLPLLWHRIDLPVVRAAGAKIDLEQRADDSNTWTFAPADGGGSTPWNIAIGEVVFEDGEVAITDAERALDVRATITRLDAPIAFGQRVAGDDPSTRREVVRRVGRAAAERLRNAAEQRAARGKGRAREDIPPYEFAWKASGTMHGEKVAGQGRIGGVLAIGEPRPFPVRADIDVGTTEIALTGTITDPTSPNALDMRLWISGQNLAKLYSVAGIALPNTPPYATVGRLAGRFHPHRSRLRYEDFTARVGGSDLAGTLTYESEGRRPKLSGAVESTLLQFRDLGAVIGARMPDERASGDDESAPPAGRVLPVVPFAVERWKAMDADVRFTGKRVVRTEELPISDVEARVRMDSGVLAIEPLTFGMAGGKVDASIRIDANPDPPKGVASLEARKLKLRRLFEKVDGLSESLGEVSGDVKLAGRGPSLGAIIGTSDGALRFVMTEGRVSEVLMEKAGLNLANVLLARMRGDQRIAINCAAAALTVQHGLARTDLFVFDTENALIEIDGTIDLGRERIDLTLHPHTKNARIFSLRSPLLVEGSFEHVDVSVDKKALFARGGGAIGLGLIAAPLAALVPLTALGKDDETKSCAPLVAEIRKTDAKAPRPKKEGGKPGKTP